MHFLMVVPSCDGEQGLWKSKCQYLIAASSSGGDSPAHLTTDTNNTPSSNYQDFTY